MCSNQVSDLESPIPHFLVFQPFLLLAICKRPRISITVIARLLHALIVLVQGFVIGNPPWWLNGISADGLDWRKGFTALEANFGSAFFRPLSPGDTWRRLSFPAASSDRDVVLTGRGAIAIWTDRCSYGNLSIFHVSDTPRERVLSSRLKTAGFTHSIPMARLLGAARMNVPFGSHSQACVALATGFQKVNFPS